MRPRIDTGIGMAVVVLAGIAAGPVGAQQVGARGIGVPLQNVAQQPLTPPPAAQPRPRPQSQPQPGKQLTQVLQDSDSGLSTQDCANMPTAVEMTDCLNRVSEGGQYIPTPKPAPGAQMPMSYRLPLGTRPLNTPP